jgi:hypothetical protein
MMDHVSTDELPTVDDWEDVPAFASEDEEAEFWATHGLGGRALESLGTLDDDELPPPRPRRRRIAAYVSTFSHLIPPQRVRPHSVIRPPEITDGWLRAS